MAAMYGLLISHAVKSGQDERAVTEMTFKTIPSVAKARNSHCHVTVDLLKRKARANSEKWKKIKLPRNRWVGENIYKTRAD